MQTRDKIYIIVPSTLLGLTLILLVFNSYIVIYLPVKILSTYPFLPCPPRGVIAPGGVPRVYDIHFLSVKANYHVGEPINPHLVSTTSFAVYVPRIYITNSANQTIWVYGGYPVRDNCHMTLHYSLQDLTEPPRLNQAGQYEMFAGDSDKHDSFRFSVIP